MKPVEGVAVDWSSALHASFQIRQSFRYEYPTPIRNLNHRLVVIPPERFGDQRRGRHSVSAARAHPASGAVTRPRWHRASVWLCVSLLCGSGVACRAPVRWREAAGMPVSRTER